MILQMLQKDGPWLSTQPRIMENRRKQIPIDILIDIVSLYI